MRVGVGHQPVHRHDAAPVGRDRLHPFDERHDQRRRVVAQPADRARSSAPPGRPQGRRRASAQRNRPISVRESRLQTPFRRAHAHPMHLTPREQERLLLASGADLARRRLARGARLGAPEAVALVCDEICELAWDGLLLRRGRRPRSRGAPPRAARRRGAVRGPGAPGGGAVPARERARARRRAVRSAARRRARGRPARRRGHRAGARAGTSRPRCCATPAPSVIWVSSHVPLDRLNPALDVRLPAPGRYRLDVAGGHRAARRPRSAARGRASCGSGVRRERAWTARRTPGSTGPPPATGSGSPTPTSGSRSRPTTPSPARSSSAAAARPPGTARW